MGCCCSCCNSAEATETTALLSDDNDGSHSIKSESIRSKSYLVDKPNCKCNQPMHLYELQCCYISTTNLENDSGLYQGTTECQNCLVEVNEPTTLVWHCTNKSHYNEYKYDLCIECGEILYQKQNNEGNDEEKKVIEKYTIFDKQYNVEDEKNDININWNNLYEIANDDGKILHVTKNIGQYIKLYPNYREVLPSNILKFIDKCHEKEELANRFHHTLHTHDEWINVVDNVDDISIWYKKEQGSDIHSLKSRILLRCTGLDIICVLNEFDLLHELISIVPFDTILLQEPSVTSKILFIKVHLWFPLKNRDCVFSTQAFDLLDDYGEILICGKSIDPNIDVDDVKQLDLHGRDDVLKCDNKTVRIEAKHSMGAIRPIKVKGGADNPKNENLTEIISVINLDPKVYMPTSLLNWVNRTMAFYQAKMIRHRCENLKGTEHAKRQNSKPIYRKWKRDMKEYIQKTYLIEQQLQKLQLQQNQLGQDGGEQQTIQQKLDQLNKLQQNQQQNAVQ